MDDIILIGFGGHAKSVADCIERMEKYNIIGYTDREANQSKYKYLGTDEVLPTYLKRGYDKIVVCVGYLGRGNVRENIYAKYKEMGFSFPVIIDPTAVVSSSAVIREGCFIGKNAVVNAEAEIGAMCIINTGAIVEHECKVNDFAHVAVGAVLCGQVKVGKAAFVGANATVIQCREIHDKQIVPAGVTIR